MSAGLSAGVLVGVPVGVPDGVLDGVWDGVLAGVSPFDASPDTVSDLKTTKLVFTEVIGTICSGLNVLR